MLIRILTLLTLASTIASAFVVNHNKCATANHHHQCIETKLYGTVANRRDFLNKASSLLVGGVAATALLTVPQTADAKEQVVITPEEVSAAWKEVELELTDPRGGVAKLQKYIDEEDWENILSFTKEYDQFLRRGKWGRCKALLPPGPAAYGTMLGNNITFDLIGINKGARTKEQSQKECNRYLNELRTDLGLAIEQKKEVVYPSPAPVPK